METDNQPTCSSSTASSSECESRPVVSLLEKLRAPSASELGRKRKIDANQLLLQPSSAAAECVFSILNRISDKQMNSLEDYVESTVMLQYNKHKNKE